MAFLGGCWEEHFTLALSAHLIWTDECVCACMSGEGEGGIKYSLSTGSQEITYMHKQYVFILDTNIHL